MNTNCEEIRTRLDCVAGPISILLMLLVCVVGCEGRLENPADPEAGDYIGFRPWVDSGQAVRATISDTLDFEGVFHGPLDKVDRYEWDFHGDGRIDFRSPSVSTGRWAFEEVGEYHAIFTVWDRTGFSKSDTTDVIITNEVPAPDGGPDQNGFLRRTVGLPARASDDGRILEYRWDYEGDGEIDWSGVLPETLWVLYSSIGQYRAVLEVVDDDANRASDTVAVSISLGRPLALAGPDTAVSINDVVVFRGSGIDSNGTVNLYEWDFDGDGNVDWSSDRTGKTERLFESLGTWLATLRVTDDDGFSHADTARVTVTDEAPYLQIFDLGDGWCAEPETLLAEVGDDGNIVLYEWDFDGDGTFDWLSETTSRAAHRFERGVYFPILRVTDDDGNVATGTLTFRVGPWTRGSPMRFARSGISAEAVGGVLYAMSGAVPELGAYTSVVEAYDPESKSWEMRRPMVLAQSSIATTVLNGRIFGIAGCARNADRGAVEEYIPQYDMWKRHSSVQNRRCWPAAAAVNGLIYVFGGQGEEELSSVETLNPREGVWREVSPMPTARHGMAAVTVAERVYVIGGYGGGRPLSTVEVYDPATDTWATGNPMPTPRTGLAAVEWNSRIYTLGGSYLNVVEVYDPATDTWSTATPMPTPRYGHGAAVIGDMIYVVGGETLWSFLTILEIYAPACD